MAPRKPPKKAPAKARRRTKSATVPTGSAPPEPPTEAPDQPVAREQLPTPQFRGRPTVWTPLVRETFMRAVKLGTTMKDAAAMAGISYDAWLNLAAGRSKDPNLLAFADLVEQERARVKTVAVGKVLATRQWKAQAWWLSVTDPKHYGPQVRVTLDREFDRAISNLERDFAEQPELLARILDSLTREEGGRGEATPGLAPPADPGPADPIPDPEPS